MEQDLEKLNQIIQNQEQKIDKIYISVEKTRKYLLWTMIATIAFFVLPLIAMTLFLPSLIGTYTETLSGIAF